MRTLCRYRRPLLEPEPVSESTTVTVSPSNELAFEDRIARASNTSATRRWSFLTAAFSNGNSPTEMVALVQSALRSLFLSVRFPCQSVQAHAKYRPAQINRNHFGSGNGGEDRRSSERFTPVGCTGRMAASAH